MLLIEVNQNNFLLKLHVELLNMNTNLMNLEINVKTYPWHARFVLKVLEKLKVGQLELVAPDGAVYHFSGSQKGIAATMHVKDWRVSKECIKSGDIGLAETYIDGLWETSDLQALLRLFASNREALEQLIYGSWWGTLLYRIKHWFHRNSKSGSKKNIHAHYDIGNSFYSLWLDPSMTYSSAYFGGKDISLHEAQQAKYNKIIDSIKARQGDRVLEVGCGWGGFMEAALSKDLQVDCLTISTEQAKYAIERANHLPKGSKAQILLQDYRDHKDQYDGIASIEMFEAVGQAYWPDYFQMLERCLKPGKRACIQTIVIADELFDKYSHQSDFIQQYVFPGGMLPSLSKFKEAAVNAGLKVEGVDAFGLDYQKTLCQWHEKFNQSLSQVHSQGFDEKFVRLWNMYLMYCAAGFAEKSIDVVQVTLYKPEVAA